MKYVAEMDPGAMIYIPNFIKIGSSVQELIAEIHRQYGDIKILHLFFSKLGKWIKSAKLYSCFNFERKLCNTIINRKFRNFLFTGLQIRRFLMLRVIFETRETIKFVF
jgi:hypothetical protein